ncbi:hypothetical protein TorRG33x02_146150 [Trema orientale]|uniref:Uncharacterized protein n=1 Tax=Trema orientale TaxID=63057 RepID=A0A2P5EVR8_TREOI|nr:hypothetical protein TorRG33x02_146150 [Trema orientale]
MMSPATVDLEPGNCNYPNREESGGERTRVREIWNDDDIKELGVSSKKNKTRDGRRRRQT